ncbi:MAG: hypothetical protein KDC49_05670 [Saprospiraceae bacterium]|nr:hypothetical protein [Saprospiraceae bacterium]
MAVERTICPHCKRPLRNAKAWHYCEEVSMDDLFADKSDTILLIFDAVMQEVVKWEDVEMSATKNCVVFVRNKTFLVVKPMTKFLEIKFYSEAFIEDDDLYKCTLWNNKHHGILRISHENELKSSHFQYFRESYLMS